ncbi:hypothetical protein BC830DRAFT_1096068 [Chytriomyces sp. MP71]|nr:hypothetical protein BC830DRAFT_1096068 [Chytriomyces sp. MP71]
MDKYSKWRDADTGINPFLPTKGRRTESTQWSEALAHVKNLLGPLAAIAKLAVLALIALLAFLLVHILGAVLTPLPLLRREWDKVVAFLCGRLALFLLGFYSITVEEVLPHKSKLSLREKNSIKKTTLRSMEPGDIIIANHSSYIDILYLATMYAPTFTQISPDANTLRAIPLHEALLATGAYPILNHPAANLTLATLVARARADPRTYGPIVVFPEATTTNGRALLRACDVWEGLKEQDAPRLHLVGLRYPCEEFSPAYVVGGKLSHLIGLASQFVNRLVVRVAFHHDAHFEGVVGWRHEAVGVGKNVGFHQRSSKSPSGTPVKKSVGGSTPVKRALGKMEEASEEIDVDRGSVTLHTAVEDMLVEVSKLKLTRLTVKDKASFFDFWINMKK